MLYHAGARNQQVQPPAPAMSKALQQINIAYVPAQDRLLLRVKVKGDGEYRVWLTRRYTSLLTGILHDQINLCGGMHEAASRKETLGMLKGGAFDRPFQEPATPLYPLGEAGVLGFRINVTRSPRGTVNLQLVPEQGQGLDMNLDTAMLYLLYNLLEQALGRTDWHLPLPQQGSAAVH